MSNARWVVPILVLGCVPIAGAAGAAAGAAAEGAATSAKEVHIVMPDDRLPLAAERGDQAAVEALLRAHVSVNDAEGDGMTALHWAVYQNNLPLAEVLLRSRANVNAKTRIEAATPIFLACRNGSAQMIELLLNHGASATEADTLGTTPLMMAAASGNADAVTVLLKHGANPNSRESAHQQTALMFAANLDRGDAIRALVAHGADPNLQSKVTTIERPVRNFGFNGNAADPSDVASAPARKGRYGNADSGSNESDAEAGSHPGARKTALADSQKQQAPLRDANQEVATADPAKKLPPQQQYRGDRGPTMMGGFAPLHYAARQGSIAATVALLDEGANINEVTQSEQSTPLVLAIANGHLDLAKVLVDRGADVNKANVMGVTPLYATIDVQWVPHEWSPEPIVAQEKTSYLELMQLLLQHGADPNARLGRSIWSRVLSENRVWVDVAGSTAFLRAAMADDVKAMQLLKAGGADPDIPTQAGTTPLMAAAGVGWGANYSVTAPDRMAAVKYCISQGGKITDADTLGFTSLHGAAFVGDLQLIKFLVANGAQVNAKSKSGDSVADYANGPFEKSLPQPAAVALLVSLGAVAPTNCRSSDCIPATRVELPGAAGRRGRRRPQGAAAAADDEKPETPASDTAATTPAASKPVAPSAASPH